MTHALTPTTGTSWWKRILTLEPVAVQAAVRAVLLLVTAVLAGFGLNLPDTIEPWLLGVVAAFYVAVEAITTMLARRRATPTARVVQVVEPDGTVVAGPASRLADGTPITTQLREHDIPGGRLVQFVRGDRVIAQVSVPADEE